MTPSASSTHKVQVDSYSSNPRKVTLYAASNSAQVERRFEVSVQPGKTEIDLENLPNGVEEDTLRVEGYGDEGVQATIVDVICLPIALRPEQVDSKAVVDVRKKIHFNRTVLESIHAQEALLENYSAALTPGTTPASELGAYLSLSSTKTLELAQAKTKTEDEIEELEAELSKLQDGEKDETEGNGKTSEAKLKRTADELRGQRRRTIRVLVEVEGGEVAENKTEDRVVNILLVYVIRGARWSPLYDIRAKTLPATSQTDEKGRRAPATSQPPKVPLAIHYRASIINSTGEPWVDTQVILSTASPHVGSAIPTLQPYRIGPPQPMLYAAAPSAAFFGSAPPPPASRRMASVLERGERLDAVAPKKRMLMRSAQVGGMDDEAEDGYSAFQAGATVDSTRGSMSAVLKIDGTSDIEDDGAAHKVSITSLDLEADLTRITVPSAAASAFLRASVKNASAFPLLPGPTTIYLDGSLVGKGHMADVAPDESFKVSLGVDKGVRITFHPEIKDKKTSGGIITSKTETASFIQKVTVENLSQTRITLLIQSRFPISEDRSTATVRLVVPCSASSLPFADADGLGGVTRWVEGRKEEGMVEWFGGVAGREKKVWRFGWEVEGSGWVVRG